MAGQDDSGAQRLGQDKLIAGLQAGLAQDLTRFHQAGDGEAQRGLRCLRTVAAHQRAPRLVQDLAGAQQHCREFGPHLVAAGIGDGRDCECRPGVGAHRIEVRQGVGRGDLTEHEWIVDETTKVIN